MRTVDVLREARERYAAAPSHASAGDLPTPGTLCVVLAIDDVAREDTHGISCDIFDSAVNAFAAAHGGEMKDVVAFNAVHSTEEVLAVFDKAIEALA